MSFPRDDGDPNDAPPPPYEEVESKPPPQRPTLSTQNLSSSSTSRPRPHSASNPAYPSFPSGSHLNAPPSPSPSHLSPQSPHSPNGSVSLSPYPGRASQQLRPPSLQNHPRRHSNPHPPNPQLFGPGPGPGSPINGPGPGSGEIPRQFPQIFNVYLQSFSRMMYLGEHQSHPLYALKSHSGFANNSSLILHSGPTDRFPPLATLDYHPFSTSMVVALPPAPVPGAPSEIELESSSSFSQESYVFTIEVGNGGPRARGGGWPLEQFEWRRSRGDAVASLGGRSYGWKLVRLAGGPPPGASAQGRARYVTGGFQGSDGSEVVAAFAESAYSFSKAMTFAFLGTGVWGLLGERWAIMAVMSAMGLFERERRNRRRR